MKSILKLCLFFCLWFLFGQCSVETSQTKINTEKILIDSVKIKRLDVDLFLLNTQNIKAKTVEFQAKYNSFYQLFISNILNPAGLTDTLYEKNVLRFVNDKDMLQVKMDIQKTFTTQDFQFLEQNLTEIIARFKVLFPNKNVPVQFVTFSSGFNYNTVFIDSTLGIGLEMYLEQKNKFYTMLQIPKYLARKMDKAYILSDAIRTWLITIFENFDEDNNLLSNAIYYGKLFYVTKALAPKINDSLIIAYTNKQLENCKKYEKNYWKFLIKDNKLFQKKLDVISTYITDGPFTTTISKECPPRIAMWYGWKIVNSYMKQNPKVSINELMRDKDYQKIFSKSKYKP